MAFTPPDARHAEVAIVVDVLRASSTIVTALAAGRRRVLCCGDVEGAERLRAPGRALAGERGCRRIPGFDYGNSPATPRDDTCEDLVLCTTNGSPAIVAAAGVAEEVLVGSLLNLEALIDAVPADADVTVICAGTDGRLALEDAYVAGRIVAGLGHARTDAARAAERLAGAYPEPLEALAESADAATLRAVGAEGDIAFCARESVLAIVPRVAEAFHDMAVVEERSGHGPDPSRLGHRAAAGAFESGPIPDTISAKAM